MVRSPGVPLCVLLISSVALAQQWVQLTPVPAPQPRSDGHFAWDPVGQRLLLHGGRGQRSGNELSDVWQLLDDVWRPVATAHAPPGRTSGYSVWDTARNRWILFGGYVSGGAQSSHWEFDGTDWTEVTPSAALPRTTNAAAAWDAERSRIVFFGGETNNSNTFNAETWEYDGTGWTRRMPTTSPPARGSAVMAYDPVRKVTVLFGGFAGPGMQRTDTWEYDGTTWREVATGAPPTQRPYVLFWHPQLQRVVGLGPGVSSDIHAVAFDGTSWSEFQTDRNQLGLGLYPLVAYDPVHQRTVVLNNSGNDGIVGYAWTGTSFTPFLPLEDPGEPRAAFMFFDRRVQAPVMLGEFDGPTGRDVSVWRYDGLHWRRVVTSGTPPSVFPASGATYDEGRQVVVVHNGAAYELSGTVWTLKSPTVSPPFPRSQPTLGYHAGLQRVVLFGGVEGFDTYRGDTWTWDGTTWTQLTPPSSPPSRGAGAMGWDPERQRLVLYAGIGLEGTQSRYLRDTWEFDGVTWAQRTPTPPPQFGSPALAFDPVLKRLVLWGEQYSSADGPDLMWEYGGAWFHHLPDPMPGTDRSGAMAYDPVGQRTLLYLPNTFSSGGETWAYLSPGTTAPDGGTTPSVTVTPIDGVGGSGGTGGGAGGGGGGAGGGGDAKPSGCGCAASPGAAMLGWLVAAAVVRSVRRRRRG